MIFFQLIEKYDSPAKIFAEINEVLCEYLDTENYLTAFLGIIDPIQNHMVFSRAGHVKPMLLKKENSEIVELDAKGFFIGHAALKDIAKYTEEDIFLDPGDRLLLYTDGLTEGSNKKNILYGTERLRDVIVRSAELSPNDFLDTILSEQTDFLEGVPLRDDFTMLCVDVLDSSYLLNDSGFLREDKPEMLIVNRKDEIEDACSLVLREMDNFGFTDREIKRFKICFFEIVINGIEHGNLNSIDKRVVIFYKVDNISVSVSIIDEGKGFEYDLIPNPLDEENLLKESGRGVFIARRYADKVIFNKRGNRVFLEMLHKGR